jgi:hypothetical protein
VLVAIYLALQGFSLVETGLLLTGGSIGASASAVVVGLFGDAFGRRRAVLILAGLMASLRVMFRGCRARPDVLQLAHPRGGLALGRGTVGAPHRIAQHDGVHAHFRRACSWLRQDFLPSKPVPANCARRSATPSSTTAAPTSSRLATSDSGSKCGGWRWVMAVSRSMCWPISAGRRARSTRKKPSSWPSITSGTGHITLRPAQQEPSHLLGSDPGRGSARVDAGRRLAPEAIEERRGASGRSAAFVCPHEAGTGTHASGQLCTFG